MTDVMKDRRETLIQFQQHTKGFCIQSGICSASGSAGISPFFTRNSARLSSSSISSRLKSGYELHGRSKLGDLYCWYETRSSLLLRIPCSLQRPPNHASRSSASHSIASCSSASRSDFLKLPSVLAKNLDREFKSSKVPYQLIQNPAY